VSPATPFSDASLPNHTKMFELVHMVTSMEDFDPSPGKTGSAGYLPVDKTLPRSEGLYKKHKNWRETEVVNFWYSSSEETCSN
jgi:hypothetical protein